MGFSQWRIYGALAQSSIGVVWVKLAARSRKGVPRMRKSEREILEKLRGSAEETVALFSNTGQGLQERIVVAGLLRVFGIEFSEDEIVKRGPEPIDVWFREARFQVTEILDRGRPRNLEIRQRSMRARHAESLRELVEPGVISSRPIAPDELLALVLKRCREKAQRYAGDCSDIDLLIYVNLQRRHLYPSGPFPEATAALGSFGWRSVSLIMEPFAVVLRAADNAPAFLIGRGAEAVFWQGLDSVFPRLRAE
jgi:hypothetical protein